MKGLTSVGKPVLDSLVELLETDQVLLEHKLDHLTALINTKLKCSR